MANLSLSRLPWKAQLAVFVVLAGAGAGAFYYFYEIPHAAALAKQQQELATIRGRIGKGLATARQLPEFRKEVDNLQLRLESLRPILPEEKDAADLLRRIQTLATQSNLTIRSFKPQPTAVRELHAEWPISLELEGTYHNFGAFLDRVSKFPRIINVGKIEIKGKDKSESDATLNVSCTATTFVLMNPAATDANSKPKGAAKPTPKKA